MTMLPRLQAEEQLDAVRAGALAAGAYEKDVQRTLLDRLHAAATGGGRQRARRPQPAMLGAMGIGLVTVAASSGSSAGSCYGPAPSEEGLTDG